MAAKKTKVELTVKVGDSSRSQEFDLGHAERILLMPSNGGWALPSKSRFELREGKLKAKSRAKASK